MTRTRRLGVMALLAASLLGGACGGGADSATPDSATVASPPAVAPAEAAAVPGAPSASRAPMEPLGAVDVHRAGDIEVEHMRATRGIVRMEQDAIEVEVEFAEPAPSDLVELLMYQVDLHSGGDFAALNNPPVAFLLTGPNWFMGGAGAQLVQLRETSDGRIEGDPHPAKVTWSADGLSVRIAADLPSATPAIGGAAVTVIKFAAPQQPPERYGPRVRLPIDGTRVGAPAPPEFSLSPVETTSPPTLVYRRLEGFAAVLRMPADWQVTAMGVPPEVSSFFGYSPDAMTAAGVVATGFSGSPSDLLAAILEEAEGAYAVEQTVVEDIGPFAVALELLAVRAYEVPYEADAILHGWHSQVGNRLMLAGC